MPQRHKIKWRDSDERELQRVIDNYNAKIRRVEKNNPEISEYQPKKMTKKEFKQQIVTRADYNRMLNSLKRYSKKGSEDVVTNEKGLTTSKYIVQEVKTKVRIINQKRTNEAKKLGLSEEKGTAREKRERGLGKKKFDFATKSPKDFEKFLETIEKQVKDGLKEQQLDDYKQNYLKMIDTIHGDDALIKELKKRIQGMDAQKVFNETTSNPLLQIDFHYDELMDYDLRKEGLLSAWSKVK